MKSIELKSAKEVAVIGGRNTEIDITTIDLLKIVVNTAPEKGFTPSEMTDRIRVLDAIDAYKADPLDSTAAVLQLEDADYENVKKWLPAVKWAYLSRFIAAFTAQFK